MPNNDYFSGFTQKAELFHDKVFSYWENGYRTLMPADGKRIFIKGWQHRGEMPIQRAELEPSAAYYRRHNLSVVFGPACPIIAIDIDSKPHADDLEALVIEALGATPLTSIGDYPKRKLIYAKVDGDTYESRRFQPFVELFSNSGQVVLEGMHPKTKRPYSWVTQSPADTPVTDLPKVSAKQLNVLERAIFGWMRENGYALGTKAGVIGRGQSHQTGEQADLLAQMRMERKSCKTKQEFIACTTRHLQAMQVGTRHSIMTATVAAMVRRDWADERIIALLQKHYIERFGDDRSMRTKKVVKAITSARKRQTWQPQYP